MASELSSSLHTITVKTLGGDLITLTSSSPFNSFSVRYKLQTELGEGFHPAHFVLFSYDEENKAKEEDNDEENQFYKDGETYGLYIRDHLPHCDLKFLIISYDPHKNEMFHKYEFTVFCENSDEVLFSEIIYYSLSTKYLLPPSLFQVLEETNLEEIVRRYPIYMEACADMYDMIMELCNPYTTLNEFDKRYLAEIGLQYFQEIEEEIELENMPDEDDEPCYKD